MTRLLIIGVLFLGGCFAQSSSEPSVEFTRIPSADPGGTVRLENIEGRVINSRQGYKIVLYARSGEWYVQPFIEEPFTQIQPDSTWKSATHLGTEYAALLVTPEFEPPAKTVGLPEKSDRVIAVTIVEGAPLFWQTWWFRLLLTLIGGSLIITFLRLRFQKLTNEMNVRFEERLAERTRIAQELHDSLLQGFVGVSIQLNVAVDQLPDKSPAKPQLNRIIQTIGQVIEEGRNTVQGLRSSDDENFTNFERRFSQIVRDLHSTEKVDFQFIEKGAPRKLQPAIADEIYYIVREALFNAYNHSGADKIEIIVKYDSKNYKISVLDNGRGIDPAITETGREGHWGIQGMRERAQKIGANLKIASRINAGTEVELSVPNHAAFKSFVKNRAFGWLSGVSAPKSRTYNLKEDK